MMVRMTALRPVVLAVFFSTVATACSGSSKPTKAGSACVTAADCSGEENCVYAIAAGCAAKGVCHELPPTYSAICSSYCGCNGTQVYSCADDNDGTLVPGAPNARAPVSGRWPCADGGSK